MSDTFQFTLSADTLERLPARAFTFLSAVAGNAAVRQTLEARGYTVAVHRHGWSLLDEVSGRVSLAPAATSGNDAAVDEAVAEVDAWDEVNFGVARAALQHRHPEQCAYVFANNLQAQRGKGSVLAVLTFLRRLDTLESSPDREATRADDRAALDVLAQRGIGPAERAHMLSRVAVAQDLAPAPGASPAPATHAATRDPKRELYAWYAEWTGVARSLIKQRKLLIAMGLASPRKAKTAVSTVVAPPAQRPSVAPPQ